MRNSIKITNNSEILGIVSCLPNNKVSNNFYKRYFSEEEIEKVCKSIGVDSRFLINPNLNTSDLCLEGAKHLINKLNWNKNSIDGIILLTQTPDAKLPASAFKIHKLLGLSSNAFAFDVNLGCSAYPYGLWLASALMQTGSKRILLLAGDTISKISSRKDRSTSLLFGDAGTATAIESTDNSKWKFVLGSDGNGYENIKAEFDSYLNMNGSKVFEFTLSKIPSLIESIDEANSKPHELYFFHQANNFMLNYLRKKCKISKSSFPININRFGNTSSASIPLLMTDYFMQKENNSITNIALIGFGVGFSWAAASLNINQSIFFDRILFEN